jgi:type I restriction-modification system, restriction subunit
MSHAQILEYEFESNICSELGERGWLYQDDGDTDVAGWDEGLALVPGDVLHWLATQYPDDYEKAIPADLMGRPRDTAERALLTHLTKELSKTSRIDTTTGKTVGGLLGVLRTGFTYAQVGRPAAKFGPMIVFPPARPELIDVSEASDAVRLRVMRQVRFDITTNETIDVVLCANGIPVATMELKTDNTQSVNHAIGQYKNDRKPGPKRPLLAPGRVLVHFAVSNDLVFMTTKLAGENTVFLPFNQGNNGHEGNPPSTIGSPSNYLWRDILSRPSFMRILKDYALFEPGRGAKKNDGRLVFPRFHQLRAVERIINDIETKGPGGRYLVWHSAGSGKTKTIAWLSHRLIRHVDSEARSTFDSVIVVTDRTVLDENIRGDMGLVQSSKGLVVTVGEKSGAKSPQLKKALIEGDHIITCTLQTFPEVMKLIEDTSELRGRNWAVVADEAHSSQSGSSARGLKALLADIDVEDPENVSADELLAAKDSAIAASSNITFIALTATPKAKTLRLFGEQDEDGNWRAFDTYTMAQAIEEGFILDVLTNYSTYDMFLRVKNELENSEEETLVDTGHAVTAIVQFARLHPTAIAQKVRVVVEHFHRNVKPLLTGSARAMVVTSSRIEAYRWFEAMNAYIDKAGYSDIRPLVAFSGSLESDDGETVTEASLNGRNDTARAFREEDYKILIVANKFQTGFDEPCLMAMYVDKKLSGIAAVQTLSRLNRTYPGKTAPMVVDFQNTPASIQDDFKMYYSDARVVGEVDPNSLITIAERLDTAGIYTMQEMAAVADAYLSDAGGEAIAKALGPIKGRWQSEWNHARRIKDNELKDSLRSFRADTISYRNAWQFLSQIVDYQDPDLHKRAILATLLSRNLHMEGNQYDDSYLEAVQLSGVQLVPSAINEDHSLSEGSDEAMVLPGFDGEYRGSQTPAKGPLTEVIERVNEMFRVRNIDVAEGSVAGFISTFWGFLGEDEAAQAMAKNNSPSQLKASADFSHAVGIAMLRTCQENQEIQSYMQDQSFLQNIVEITADAMQAQHSRDGNSSGNVAK